MRPSRAVGVLMLLFPLPGLLAAGPAAAASPQRTAPSAMAGFAQVLGSAAVNPLTSYDSAGGTITVGHPITGVYDVSFGGLGFTGGDVQVTPRNLGAECSVATWGQDPGGAALDVRVLCYNTAGALSDRDFTLLVTQPHTRPNGVLDYSWVYKLNGKLTNRWSYNSSHKVNSVKRLAKGKYLVTMPGPGLTGANNGTVKVTPFGTGGGSCQIAAWHTTKAGEQVTVVCFTASGARRDREFNIVYARGNNLMGQNGKTTANAYANGGATIYQPKVQFDSKHHARVTVVHLDRGFYEVLPVGSNAGNFPGGQGNVQVTAVAGALRSCAAFADPTHTPQLFIGCFDASGKFANTAFTVQWVVG
jgi:hypothetical protein